MSSSAKKKPAYDPARQWGLKPERSNAGVGATYVVSGHVVSGSASDPREMYIGESVGREAQARAARKVAAKEADEALRRLLARDKAGTRALASAREFSKKKEEPKGSKAKGKQRQDAEATARTTSAEKQEEEEERKLRKNAYSAELIKQLGFDPTGKDGRPAKDAMVQNKVGVPEHALGGGR